MPLVSDHKKLKDKISALKERYVDKKYNSMDDPTVARYNHKISPPPQKKLGLCRNVQDQPSTGKHTQSEDENAFDDNSHDISFYVNSLEVKMSEVRWLKTELRATREQLKKATKPLQQKASNWVRK